MIKKVVERQEIQLPPSWCSRICRNSMNDVCVEHCAIKRDCSFFEHKKIPFEDIPAFPLQDFSDLSKEEKGTILAVYLLRITAFLQGVDYERPITNRPRGVKVPKAVQIPGLFDAEKEATAVYSSERAADRNPAK